MMIYPEICVRVISICFIIRAIEESTKVSFKTYRLTSIIATRGEGGPGREASIETGFRRKPINRAREISMPAGNEAAP